MVCTTTRRLPELSRVDEFCEYVRGLPSKRGVRSARADVLPGAQQHLQSGVTVANYILHVQAPTSARGRGRGRGVEVGVRGHIGGPDRCARMALSVENCPRNAMVG